jgi:hypothetical protein
MDRKRSNCFFISPEATIPAAMGGTEYLNAGIR